MGDLTLRERWQNIVDDWNGTRREVRRTAVGWRPPGRWTEECNDEIGVLEYHQIVRAKPINKWKELEKGKSDERNDL